MASKKTKNQKSSLSRKILTVYSRYGNEVKRNRSVYLESACVNCFDHMSRNHYEASAAEVYDEETGELYLTIYLTVEGNIYSFYGPGAKKKIRENKRLLKKMKSLGG